MSEIVRCLYISLLLIMRLFFVMGCWLVMDDMRLVVSILMVNNVWLDYRCDIDMMIRMMMAMLVVIVDWGKNKRLINEMVFWSFSRND